MFKTIFSKLVTIIIAILILSFIVTGSMLFYFLDDYTTKQEMRELEMSGNRINSFLQLYIENKAESSSNIILREILRSYRGHLPSIVWVVDEKGQLIIPEINELPPPIAEKFVLNSSGKYSMPDERQYKRILSGREDIIKEIGDFYGLFKETNQEWLTVEMPFKYNDVIRAVTFISIPLPDLQKTRSSVFSYFLISMGVAVFISIILIYIFSIHITKPLIEINKAAKVIARGEFGARLTFESKDEIGQLTKSFNQMVISLKSLEDMRREFIANVSHELRTPMTSIRGFVEGILDGTIPVEKQDEYLEIVRDETNRLNKLVNNLLDLAKIEAQDVPLDLKNFDINELIRRSIIKLESLILNKNITIEAHFDMEQMIVDADSEAIEQVIINLIDNAIKFSYLDSTITIFTVQEKEHVLVSIQNQGQGIGPDELSLIWDRFYKADKSRSVDKLGTGLGLAIVKNIIIKHGQEIWAKSEQGNYTRFTFTLKKGKDKEI